MMHTRRRILIIKRGMSTFRINDDIEMTDAPQKMNLTPFNTIFTKAPILIFDLMVLFICYPFDFLFK